MSTSTKPLVLLLDAIVPLDQAERIRTLSPAITMTTVSPFGGHLSPSVLQNASVLYTTHADFDPADAPNLRWVQLNTAAVNHVMTRPVFKSDLPIANVGGAYTVAVAEFTLAMLLALTRRIALCCNYQRDHLWPEDYQLVQGEDLYGKTMAIVGYGSIGRQVARLAQCLGMKILACKRDPTNKRDESFLLPGTGDPDGTIPKAWFGPHQIAEMFRQCDVAVVTLPLTPHTERIVGAAELAALPKHAYLLNVGRGPVIDETALIACLQASRIAGAALDVFAEEPLPASSPFWKLPNVLILPHIGSWTNMQAHRATEVLIENLLRHLKGQPLINVIDKINGY